MKDYLVVLGTIFMLLLTVLAVDLVAALQEANER